MDEMFFFFHIVLGQIISAFGVINSFRTGSFCLFDLINQGNGIMKKTMAALCCIFISTLAVAQPTRQRLDSLMDFYATEYNFSGVALIYYKGKTLLEKGYGFRDIP